MQYFLSLYSSPFLFTKYKSGNKFKLLLNKIGLYAQRSRTRKQLAKLSCTQLEDIGLNKAQALAEAKKPFWK